MKQINLKIIDQYRSLLVFRKFWKKLSNKRNLAKLAIIELTDSVTRTIDNEEYIHSKKSLSYFKKKKTYFKRNILKIRENFLGEW